MQNLLYVNDERRTLEYFGKYFANHFKVSLCEEHPRAIQLAEKFPYDAVVVNVKNVQKNNEDIETIDSIKSIDGYNDCPIFVLAKDNSGDARIRYLKFGIDDYLWEEMPIEEIILRINNNINRLKGKNVLFFGNLEVDSDKLMVIHDQKDLELTLIEFKILKYLVINSRRIVSRDELMEICWPNQSSIVDNSLSTHITNLRTKISPSDVTIRSIRGQGLKLEAKNGDDQ